MCVLAALSVVCCRLGSPHPYLTCEGWWILMSRKSVAGFKIPMAPDERLCSSDRTFCKFLNKWHS